MTLVDPYSKLLLSCLQVRRSIMSSLLRKIDGNQVVLSTRMNMLTRIQHGFRSPTSMHAERRGLESRGTRI